MQNQPHRIYTADWGILNSLRLLGRGKLPLDELCYMLQGENPAAATKQIIAEKLSASDYLLVGHTPDFEAFPGISNRLLEIERKWDYEKEMVAIISDSNGRPVFEVFRFRKDRTQP